MNSVNKANDHIFILGIHKSGTSLLRNLLDGHSQLNVLPIELHYFEHFGLPYDYPIRKKEGQDVVIHESLMNLLKEYESNDNKFADSYNLPIVNYNCVENISNDLTRFPFDSGNMENIISAIFDSYDLNYDENLPFVEKSVDNLEYAECLQFMFPKAKFIHIIRNPFSNFYALKKYLSRNSKFAPPVSTIIELLKHNEKYHQRLSNTLSNYKVVKYDDLISNPKEVMEDICLFLNVDFKQSVLEPTTMNATWEGNSTQGNSFKGVSSENSDVWKNKISNFERKLISENNAKILKKYDFEYPEKFEQKFSLKVGLKNKIHNYLYKYFDHL